VEANQSRNPRRSNEKELLKQIGKDSRERVKRKRESFQAQRAALQGQGEQGHPTFSKPHVIPFNSI